MTVRFAAYLHVPNRRLRVSSAVWLDHKRVQVRAVAAKIDGRIVAEYIDETDRSVPWWERPQARRLLTDLTGPERAFDAAIVTDFGGRADLIVPEFAAANVPVWEHELGPIDLEDPADRLILSIFGHMPADAPLKAAERQRKALPVDWRYPTQFPRRMVIDPVSAETVLAIMDRIFGLSGTDRDQEKEDRA